MIYLIAVSLVWAFSFGLIEHVLANLGSPVFVAWARTVIALPLLLPWLRTRGLGARVGGALVATGAVQYGLMYMLYIASFSYLDAHEVALLTVFTPIHVALVDGLIERELPGRALALAGVATVGAAIVQGGGAPEGDSRWTGVALVQAANLCFAVGQVVYRRVRLRRPELVDRQVFALLYVGAAAVTSLGVALGPGVDATLATAASLSGGQVVTLLYLGVIATGVCFFAWNKGAVQVSTATLAVFNNLKVPLAVLVALTVFGEHADPLRLALGGGLVLVAAAAARR